MAAKVFQIIGIVAIILGTLVFAVVFFFIGKLLKSFNKTFVGKGRDITGQMRESMKEMDIAQDQLAAFDVVATQVKAGMDSAIGVADRAVGFLRSNAFQVGLPVVFWVLFLMVAVPRGLFRRPKKKQKKEVKPIPPPSWEAQPE